MSVARRTALVTGLTIAALACPGGARPDAAVDRAPLLGANLIQYGYDLPYGSEHQFACMT